MTVIGTTDLDVLPLGLGGNVFGWTADREATFAVLDAFVAGGGSMIDTADVYSAWQGTDGGESETLIGEWLAARPGMRDQVVLATKVGKAPGRRTLDRPTIRRALEGSLQRLGVDHVDLYYAHEDDATTPLEQTVAAFDELAREGRVRHLGASNYSAERLTEALDVAVAGGLTPYRVLQPHYNLLERDYERTLAPVAMSRALGVLPYFGLARGFLTGKYRDGVTVESARAAGVATYATPRGEAVLDVLAEVADAHGVGVAAVALAWLRDGPAVAAPLASARTPAQLADLLPSATLVLADDERAALDAVSAISG